MSGPWDHVAPPVTVTGGKAGAGSETTSPLLQSVVAPPDTRNRLARFGVAALVMAVAVAVALFTVTRSWPRVFVFDSFYLLHDIVFLPLKGWLWTSWYPWCLLLWVPVAGMVLAVLWSWIVGADPTRRWQRGIVNWLVTWRPAAAGKAGGRGIKLLTIVVRAWSVTGLGGEYVRSVVAHGAAEALDSIEQGLLADREIHGLILRRALCFIDAEASLAADAKSAATLLPRVFDLALIAHVPGAEREAQLRLDAVLEQFEGREHGDPVIAVGRDRGAALLRAWRDGSALSGHIEQLAREVDLLRDWSSAAPDARRRNTMPTSPDLAAQTALEAASFALYPAHGSAWVSACVATLDAVEAQWMALALGGNQQGHADALARQLRRARLATCRDLNRRRYARPVLDLPAVMLAGSDIGAADTVAAIAAGRST